MQHEHVVGVLVTHALLNHRSVDVIVVCIWGLARGFGVGHFISAGRGTTWMLFSGDGAGSGAGLGLSGSVVGSCMSLICSVVDAWAPLWAR